jgi:BirA family transcriptional regulator, biotin operon repressor / biotin---[acetyl-CoA-carboxylase] ligase
LLENIVIYESVGSTNDEAKRLFAEGVSPLETIVLARQQTGGRGRMNRHWISPEGNLYMSIITRDVLPALLSQFSLMWGVVVRQAIASLGSAPVQCKWPNDVLINDQKVAGILIEKIQGALIVGVGVNIAFSPAGVQFPSTCLKDHSAMDTQPEALAQIIREIYVEMRQTLEQQGFEPIRQKWLDSAWKLNKEINIRQSASSVVGIFDTIDESGALILKGMSDKFYVGDLMLENGNVISN